MSEQYRYGAALAEVVPAGGAKGVILRSPDGRRRFRVYHQPDDFTDYEIRHDDLSVTKTCCFRGRCGAEEFSRHDHRHE